MTLLHEGLAAFILFTSIAVYADARAIGVQKGQLSGLADLSAVGWFVACLGLWVVAFPMYLFKRGALVEANGGAVAARSATKPPQTQERDVTPSHAETETAYEEPIMKPKAKPVVVPQPHAQDDSGSRPIGQPAMPKVPPPAMSMANAPRPPPVRIPDPPSFLVSDDVDLMTGESTKTFDLNRLNNFSLPEDRVPAIDDEKTPVTHATGSFEQPPNQFSGSEPETSFRKSQPEADFETLARDKDDSFAAVEPLLETELQTASFKRKIAAVEDFTPQSFESDAHKFEKAEDERARQEKPVARKYPPPAPPADPPKHDFDGMSFSERIAHIEKLGELRDKGYLTDDEFTIEKKKLLAS